MRKRKLKAYVLPTVYTLLVLGTFLSIGIVTKLAFSNVKTVNYTKDIISNVTTPVIKNEEEKTTIKPFSSEKVTKEVDYYLMDSNEQTQENSLLVYEGNYIPSTGCLYTSDESFEILSMFDGTITKISDDNLLGKVIEVTYNTNIVAYYYSLDNVTLQENAIVKTGTVLGTSSISKISSNKNSLYVEVYNKGASINPENFYNINIDEI